MSLRFFVIKKIIPVLSTDNAEIKLNFILKVLYVYGLNNNTIISDYTF